MKSLITAVIVLAFNFTAQAQNIGYEVIRTSEAPGYFALRVLPGDQLPPLAVETVMVENFTTASEGKRYRALIKNLKKTGVVVLKPDEAVALVDDENYRLVLIGGPEQTRWQQFVATPEEDVLVAFDTFAELKLGPVYLMNLTADFGGNVSQVRPTKIPYLDDKSTYFVGQFDKAMKTRVSLSGETSDLVVQADGIMDLSTYQPHQAEGVLADLWQRLQPEPVSTWTWKKLVLESFPFLLALIGLTLMYAASRPSRLRTGMMNQINDEFWNTPIEETPIYGAWEKSIPWELSDEELRNLTTS